MNEEKTVQQEQHTVLLGEKLSALRQKLQLTEGDVAAKIRVRKAIIQDIENDKTLDVPKVFLKGYIKAYADIVGLPQDEYQPYLDSLPVQTAPVMKNYSHKEQSKRHGKRIFLISLLLILVVIGITVFFALKDDKSNLVEVTHYISPPPVSAVNS